MSHAATRHWLGKLVRTKLMNSLKLLENNRDEASERLQRAMLTRHPIDSAVRVYLNAAQYRPTMAEIVAAHGSDGTYRVKLHTINRRGNRTLKNVHWTKVVADE